MILAQVQPPPGFYVDTGESVAIYRLIDLLTIFGGATVFLLAVVIAVLVLIYLSVRTRQTRARGFPVIEAEPSQNRSTSVFHHSDP